MNKSTLDPGQKAALKKIKKERRKKQFRSTPFLLYIFFCILFLVLKQFATDSQVEELGQFFFIIPLTFLGYMLYKFVNANDRITLQKQELEEKSNIIRLKNKEILDSINYALRIQTAILPTQKIIKKHFENSFILYKPKDIVAGDFYWMEATGNRILFAACDCTGHGVPGAMVSVVCHNALNRAVREFGLTEPAAILDKTTAILIENFTTSETEIKDGMDISLCAYDFSTQTLLWSGANNPLWLIRNGELLETRADKQSIGINDYQKAFTNHHIVIQKGDAIYLFSDGFADQFGGLDDKKLTKKRFRELILSQSDKSMSAQGKALDTFISEYRKNNDQTDDILVMGVRL